MKDFISENIFWVCWLAFAAVAYIAGYLDYVYYHDNLHDKMKQVYDALTEED